MIHYWYYGLLDVVGVGAFWGLGMWATLTGRHREAAPDQR
jgi:hypothetical protein